MREEEINEFGSEIGASMESGAGRLTVLRLIGGGSDLEAYKPCSLSGRPIPANTVSRHGRHSLVQGKPPKSDPP